MSSNEIMAGIKDELFKYRFVRAVYCKEQTETIRDLNNEVNNEDVIGYINKTENYYVDCSSLPEDIMFVIEYQLNAHITNNTPVSCTLTIGTLDVFQEGYYPESTEMNHIVTTTNVQYDSIEIVQRVIKKVLSHLRGLVRYLD
jgi:hypothetical protein